MILCKATCTCGLTIYQFHPATFNGKGQLEMNRGAVPKHVMDHVTELQGNHHIHVVYPDLDCPFGEATDAFAVMSARILWLAMND
jgi:hypothetical protein